MKKLKDYRQSSRCRKRGYCYACYSDIESGDIYYPATITISGEMFKKYIRICSYCAENKIEELEEKIAENKLNYELNEKYKI